MERMAEAKRVLGFAAHCRPTLAEVKAAYRKKVFESHPDRFPAHEKNQAESRFKQISEAYSCLKDGRRFSNTYARVHVVKNNSHKVYGSGNRALVRAPFVLLVLSVVSFGGLNASRAYSKQKETCPSYNPFLP